MAGRRVTIEFLGKDSTGKSVSAIEQRYGKLGAKLDRVGRRAGTVLAGGFLLAGAAAVKMGKAAAEDEASQSKLAQTLSTAAGATKGSIAQTEKYITAMGKQFGVSDEQLRPALSKLAVATGDVGKAQRLASLAMDVSAGSGRDLGAVSFALAKAQNGNVAGLARLGIATKDASGNTLSLDQITKNLAKTYSGAAAKAADTTAGKQRKLSVQYGELQEQIGAKLLPVMAKLTAFGLKTIDWVSRNQTTVGVLVVSLTALVASVWAISAAMNAWIVLTKAWVAVTKIAAAVQWALNAALTANPIGLVVVAILALGAGLVLAYKKSATFRAIVQATGAAGRVALGWIVDKARDVGAWIGRLGPTANKAKTVAVAAFKLYTKPIQYVIDLVQKLIGWISRIRFPKPPKWVGKLAGATGGVLGKIPGFASGTSFAPGGAAWVGERGPELVNLPRGSSVTPNHRLAVGGGSSQPLLVQVVMDGKVLAQSLVKRERDTGRPIGLRLV